MRWTQILPTVRSAHFTPGEVNNPTGWKTVPGFSLVASSRAAPTQQPLGGPYCVGQCGNPDSRSLE